MMNEHQYFLTIDNGGTNVKVVIVNEVGSQIAVTSFATPGIEPRPGFHEVDPKRMWVDLGRATKAALEKAGLKGTDIAGVAPVGHGKGLYTLGKDGKPFMNGILSSDSRAGELTDAFEARVSEIFPISHQHVMIMQSPVLLRWFKDNEPDKYAKVGHVLSNKDFIRYMLTGEIKQERGDVSGNNLINLETGEYDDRLLDFFGIPEIKDALPPLVSPTDQCGSITEEAAENTGIAEGTPVFAGMFDIDACSIATGVLDASHFSVTAGTWNINVFPTPMLPAQSAGLMSSFYPTGGILAEASSPTSAGNLDDILKMLYPEEVEAKGGAIYTELEGMLQKRNAASTNLLFLPFLYGSNVNLGAESSFVGLRSSNTRADVLQSVYEGVVFAHRYHIEALLRLLGHKPDAMRLSGGACNSPSWVKMFADVMDIPVELVDANELGGVGGAITSAVGTGLYSSLEDAVAHMTHVSKRIEPNKENHAIYDKKYRIYVDLLNALDPVWNPLRHVQDELEELK